MSTRVQAVLAALAAFVVAFAVVYVVGHLLAALIIALAAVAAGAYTAWLVFRYVEGHGGVRGSIDDVRR
ncbi:MAG TPA: hypothetical protein VF288_11280 [Mycobacteriales bacterium]